MSLYRHQAKDIATFIEELYGSGLQRNRYLTDEDIKKILYTIGIFRFKGYLYAFRPKIDDYSIDDVLTIYYFDKFLTRYVMELTSSVETILKSRLIEFCYKKTDNPFFYLLDKNHKYSNFRINKPSLENWKHRRRHEANEPEAYVHYCLYYKAKYLFETNQHHYIGAESTIEICDNVNYPPFHYFVESATLGVVINLIMSLKIDNYDIARAIGKSFGIKNPKTFKPYLERLNELRNRAAHRERLFNRSFRSVTGVDRFDTLRKDIYPHRFADVYLYLFFMLGRLSGYNDYDAFFAKEIRGIIDDFREDRLIAEESFGLNTKLNDKMEVIILESMGALKKPTVT